jgi:hypothetical protein
MYAGSLENLSLSKPNAVEHKVGKIEGAAFWAALQLIPEIPSTAVVSANPDPAWLLPAGSPPQRQLYLPSPDSGV